MWLLLKHLYLNHFCRFSYSTADERLVVDASELELISTIRLDDRKDIQFVKSAWSILHSELKARALPPLRGIIKDVRGHTHITSTLREGWSGKAKMRCYQTLGLGGSECSVSPKKLDLRYDQTS